MKIFFIIVISLCLAIVMLGAVTHSERAQFFGLGMTMYTLVVGMVQLHDGHKYIFPTSLLGVIAILGIICLVEALG